VWGGWASVMDGVVRGGLFDMGRAKPQAADWSTHGSGSVSFQFTVLDGVTGLVLSHDEGADSA